MERDRSEIGAHARWQADAQSDEGMCCGVDEVNKRRLVGCRAEAGRQEGLRGKAPKIGHAEDGQRASVVDADAGAMDAIWPRGDDHPQGDVIGHSQAADRCPKLWAVPLGGSQANRIPV